MYNNVSACARRKNSISIIYLFIYFITLTGYNQFGLNEHAALYIDSFSFIYLLINKSNGDESKYYYLSRNKWIVSLGIINKRKCNDLDIRACTWCALFYGFTGYFKVCVNGSIVTIFPGSWTLTTLFVQFLGHPFTKSIYFF